MTQWSTLIHPSWETQAQQEVDRHEGELRWELTKAVVDGYVAQDSTGAVQEGRAWKTMPTPSTALLRVTEKVSDVILIAAKQLPEDSAGFKAVNIAVRLTGIVARLAIQVVIATAELAVLLPATGVSLLVRAAMSNKLPGSHFVSTHLCAATVRVLMNELRVLWELKVLASKPEVWKGRIKSEGILVEGISLALDVVSSLGSQLLLNKLFDGRMMNKTVTATAASYANSGLQRLMDSVGREQEREISLERPNLTCDQRNLLLLILNDRLEFVRELPQVEADLEHTISQTIQSLHPLLSVLNIEENLDGIVAEESDDEPGLSLNELNRQEKEYRQKVLNYIRLAGRELLQDLGFEADDLLMPDGIQALLRLGTLKELEAEDNDCLPWFSMREVADLNTRRGLIDEGRRLLQTTSSTERAMLKRVLISDNLDGRLAFEGHAKLLRLYHVIGILAGQAKQGPLLMDSRATTEGEHYTHQLQVVLRELYRATSSTV